MHCTSILTEEQHITQLHSGCGSTQFRYDIPLPYHSPTCPYRLHLAVNQNVRSTLKPHNPRQTITHTHTGFLSPNLRTNAHSGRGCERGKDVLDHSPPVCKQNVLGKRVPSKISSQFRWVSDKILPRSQLSVAGRPEVKIPPSMEASL